MLALAAALLVAAEPVVSFAPRRATLGETPSLKVHLKLPGAVAGGLPPRLGATVGSVSALAAAGVGEWTATWTLPAGGPPRVAFLVVARDDEDGAVSFFPVPLRGRATVPVQTEPGARVALFVGSDEIGSVAADASGTARVQASVPPGAEKARVRATAPSGSTTEREIDLGVPPANRLALAVGEREPGKARLEILYAAPRPPPPTDLVFAAKGGSVEPASALGHGRYSALVTGNGVVEVHASVAGDAAAVGAIDVDVSAPKVATLDGAVTPQRVGVGDRAVVRLVARDADGRPVPATIAAKVGTHELPVVAKGRGLWEARIKATQKGRLRFEAKAEGGGGSAEWKGEVEVVPAGEGDAVPDAGPAAPAKHGDATEPRPGPETPAVAARRWILAGLGIRARSGGVTGGEVGFGYGRLLAVAGGPAPRYSVGWDAMVWLRGASQSADAFGRPNIGLFEAAVGAELSARLALSRGFLYAAAGPALGLASVSVIRPGDIFTHGGAFPALSARCGLGWPLSGGVFFAELGLRQPFADAAFGPGAAQLGGPGLLLGFMLEN